MIYVADRFEQEVKLTILKLKRCELSEQANKEESKKKNQKELKKRPTPTTRKALQHSGEEFIVPTAEEVQAFLDERGETRFTGERFVNFYDGCGWTMGNNRPIRDWKAVAKGWQHYNEKQLVKHQKQPTQPSNVLPTATAANQQEATQKSRRERLAAMVKDVHPTALQLIQCLAERADEMGVPQEVYSVQDMLDNVHIMLSMPEVYGEVTADRLRAAILPLAHLNTDTVMGAMLRKNKAPSTMGKSLAMRFVNPLLRER